MSCARVKSLFLINLYRQTSDIVASQYILYGIPAAYSSNQINTVLARELPRRKSLGIELEQPLMHHSRMPVSSSKGV